MSKLSEALQIYFTLNKVGVRQLAQEWGTSPPTVSRFLNGKPIEAATFLRILTALHEETP